MCVLVFSGIGEAGGSAGGRIPTFSSETRPSWTNELGQRDDLALEGDGRCLRHYGGVGLRINLGLFVSWLEPS